MRKPIFFDCEFTELSRLGTLISAGFVADTSEEFYLEVGDYGVKDCSDFVKATVLPLLSLPPVSTSEFVQRLMDWVNGAAIVLIADSDWDRKILSTAFAQAGRSLPANWLFRVAPGNFQSGLQRQIFDQELDAFFLRNPNEKRHHALSDARAIRCAYARAVEGLE